MPKPINDGPRKYWAAETDPKRLITRALERFSWHLASLRDTGRLEKMLRTHSAHYGSGMDGQRNSNGARTAGEDAELTEVHVNTIKPLANNVIGIICGTRPAVTPVATNSDSSSTAQARLAGQLNDYYDRETNGRTLEIETVRGGIICSSWTLGQEWKASAGAEVAVDADGHATYEGDIGIFTIPPWRCAFDLSASNDRERRWVLFRRRMPTHDLAERVRDPATKEKLLQLSQVNQNIGGSLMSRLLDGGTLTGIQKADARLGEDIRDEDECWVWELRHIPTPALGLGRLVRFIEPDIILWDSWAAPVPSRGAPQPVEGDEPPMPQPEETTVVQVKYPLDELHMFEYCPERIVGTMHGHTPLFDAGGLQEWFDILSTSMGTSINLMGMPHLWEPAGSGAPQTHFLSQGPVVLEGGTTPPQTLDLLPKEGIKTLVQVGEYVQGLSRQSVALNDTVMGAPPAGMPASAQALQRAQAVQYHQVAQDEWRRLVQSNANGKLRLLKRFATTERVAQISGSAGQYEEKKWKAEDIAGVHRFDVEEIDPNRDSFEGRTATLEHFQAMGVRLAPEDVLEFTRTGSMEKALRVQTAQQERIDRNVDLLEQGATMPPVDVSKSQATGEPVFVDEGAGGPVRVRIFKSDPHHLAIPAYDAVAKAFSTNDNAPAAAGAIDAMMESLRLWQALTPDECAAYRIPPLPSHLAPAMPADATPPSPGAPGPGSQAGPPKPPTDLPSPPPNPLTGEKQTAAPLSLEA